MKRREGEQSLLDPIWISGFVNERERGREREREGKMRDQPSSRHQEFLSPLCAFCLFLEASASFVLFSVNKQTYKQTNKEISKRGRERERES